MTFTYLLTSTDEVLLAISKVRLEIGDTVSGIGVRPDNSNLTDAEITVWLEDEDSHVMRTAARACEALARMWSPVANVTTGPRKEEYGTIAANWAKQAKTLRDTYGGSTSSAFSIGTVREDGYSAVVGESE